LTRRRRARSRSLRESDHNAHTRLVVLQRDGGVVELGHRCNETQAKPASWRRAAGVETVEATKVALAILGGDPRPSAPIGIAFGRALFGGRWLKPYETVISIPVVNFRRVV
jgi:hypothetical protein